MDVFVTSFNRAYGLDRVLCSLERFAHGAGRTVVLDDGTPEPYLDEIARRHPNVVIERSDLYERKATALASGSPVPSDIARVIPVPLWRRNVERASDQFLLIEDDMWLVRDVDLAQIAEGMRTLDFATVKFSLFGNDDVLWGPRTSYPDYGMMEAVPEFLRRSRASELYLRWFRLECKVAYWRASMSRPRHAIFELATRLGIVDRKLEPQYLRTLYYVAGCAFSRSFWLSCWDESQKLVWEFTQIDAALDYAVLHPEVRFGALTQDAYQWSHSTSATNRWPELGCDMNAFNRAMNEAWLNGELEGAFDREFDVDDGLVRSVLARRDDPACRPDSWTAWAERNRDLFGGLGYEIDGERRPRTP
jgi:hypothetical protein